MVSQKTKPVRIYESDHDRLFDLLNSKKRNIPEVVKYLLDKEYNVSPQTPEGDHHPIR